MNDLQKGKLWNKSLTILSIFNVLLITSYLLIKKPTGLQKTLTYLLMIYIYVCAFRGIWPRIEDIKLCAFDNKISTPILGRITATVAELSFIKFLVLITGTILTNFYNTQGKISAIKHLMFANGLIFPAILVAQVVCWVGIITTDPSWNALEESIWSLFAITKLLIYAILYFIIIGIKLPTFQTSMVKTAIPFIFIGLLSYVGFMLIVDVPMYMKRAKKHNGKYLSFIQGLKDLLKCKKVTLSYQTWKEEIPWLTMYFTITIWFSFGILLWFQRYNS